MKKKLFIGLWITCMVGADAANLPSTKLCSLNAAELEQAACLLTPVKLNGEPGSKRTSLPSVWASLLGATGAIPVPDAAAMTSYLQKKGIGAANVGGPISGVVSKTKDGHSLRYFILHDTSTPSYKTSKFPKDADDEAVSAGVMKALVKNTNFHVVIGRTGQSMTARDFSNSVGSTKFEKKYPETLGLFVGIENIQGRLVEGKKETAAPTPGFLPAHYERMAVVYVAASTRAKRWLIPAFHGILDWGITGGHNDPQNFDVDAFSKAIDDVQKSVRN